jgi:STE24 endopeptidase
MTAATILTIYLAFFGAEFVFENLLTWLNINHVKRNSSQVPPRFRGYIDEEHYKKSVAYTLENERLALATAPLHSGFILLIILSGFLGTVNTWIGQLPLPETIHGIMYIFAISLLFSLFSLPFSLYKQFSIEERYGFNRMNLGLFFKDMAKSLLISAVIAFPILLVLFWLIEAAGAFWWVWAFGAVALFQLIISVLYPLVIAPLFNTFTPLEEGSLREKLYDLAERLSFRTKGIFVMDGSKRSSHSNAYFTGLGKVKRIVLFDTLIRTLSEDQVTSVVAHELGHEKLRHVIKRLSISFALTAAAFFLISLLLHYQPLFHAFGFGEPNPHGLLVILAFCSGPFTFFLQPLFTSWSRKHEFEADRFAADAVSQTRHLKEALITLGRDNLSNINPHPLYSFYHYSHPSLGERVQALDEYEPAKP